MEKIVRLAICLLLLISFPVQQAGAASISSIGIASYHAINATKVEDGDIVVSTSKGFYLSEIPNDSRVSGIVTSSPAIALKSTTEKNTYPVVDSGLVNVKVTGVNGDIKRGDYITPSSVKGTGMKATESGFVIGVATQDLKFKNKSDIELVTVNLNFHYMTQGTNKIQNSLLDVFSMTRLAAADQPLRVFQYIMASIILLSSFVFGFLIFAKVVNTGVEALGRNPLAGKMIQLSIIFNVILIIVIIMTGVTLAYIVIRL